MAVQERSYGIIPMLNDQVLLIQHASEWVFRSQLQSVSNDDTYSKSWGFPKGHAEPEDESDIASAKRSC